MELHGQIVLEKWERVKFWYLHIKLYMTLLAGRGFMGRKTYELPMHRVHNSAKNTSVYIQVTEVSWRRGLLLVTVVVRIKFIESFFAPFCPLETTRPVRLPPRFVGAHEPLRLLSRRLLILLCNYTCLYYTPHFSEHSSRTITIRRQVQYIHPSSQSQKSRGCPLVY